MTNFTGQNVTPVTKILAAAMATGQNVILVGDPGNGKTAMTNSFLEQVTSGNYVMVRVEASSPPEKVQGAMDPVAYFNGQGMVNITVGTPYQSDIDATIIDEIGRANKATSDILLDVADRWDIPSGERYPVIATTNFMPSDEYTRALRDRFPLVYHMIVPKTINMSRLVEAQSAAGGPVLDVSHLPTIAEFKRYRDMTPTKKSQKAIADLLTNLQTKAIGEGFSFNYRRATQFYKILFHVSAWKYDSNDFDECHPDAIEMLQYAMALSDKAEAARWSAFCNSAVNQGKAAADRCRARIVKILTELGNIKNPRDRQAKLGKFTQQVQSAQEELAAALGDDDDMLDEIINQTSVWVGQAIQGKKIQ